MKNNKGQLNTITVLVSTFIVVAVVLGSGFIINEQLQDEIGTVQTTVTNEVGSATDIVNDSGFYVDRYADDGFNTPAVTEINQINGTSLNSSQYQIDTGGLITNASIGTFTGAVNVSYTFYSGEEGYKGITNVSSSMTTLVDLLPLIVLIVVISVVLLVLFGVFPGGRSSGA